MSENRDANDLLANEATMAFDGDFSKIPAMTYVGKMLRRRKASNAPDRLARTCSAMRSVGALIGMSTRSISRT